VVLESADPDYFVPHVDLTKVARSSEGMVRLWRSASLRRSRGGRWPNP